MCRIDKETTEKGCREAKETSRRPKASFPLWILSLPRNPSLIEEGPSWGSRDRKKDVRGMQSLKRSGVLFPDEPQAPRTVPAYSRCSVIIYETELPSLSFLAKDQECVWGVAEGQRGDLTEAPPPIYAERLSGQSPHNLGFQTHFSYHEGAMKKPITLRD